MPQWEIFKFSLIIQIAHEDMKEKSFCFWQSESDKVKQSEMNGTRQYLKVLNAANAKVERGGKKGGEKSLIHWLGQRTRNQFSIEN